MLVRDLIRELEDFGEDEEFVVEVSFPQIDWAVNGYPGMVEVTEEGQPAFRVEVYEGDFDYPDILQRIKVRVDAIPEWAIFPMVRGDDGALAPYRADLG